jgi:hypothetical protein
MAASNPLLAGRILQLGGMHAAELDPQAREVTEFEECSAYMLRTVRDIDMFVTKYAARLVNSASLETAKVGHPGKLRRHQGHSSPVVLHLPDFSFQ